MLAAPSAAFALFLAFGFAFATVLPFHLVKVPPPQSSCVCVYFIVIGISVAQRKWKGSALKENMCTL